MIDPHEVERGVEALLFAARQAADALAKAAPAMGAAK